MWCSKRRTYLHELTEWDLWDFLSSLLWAILSEQKWLGHGFGNCSPFQEPKLNMQPGMPAEPVSGPAGKGRWKQERSQVAGTALKLKDLLWVHSHRFFQVCGFYLQQCGTKDRGFPAFRQKKELLPFTANHFQEAGTPLHFPLGVNFSLSTVVKCCWPGECLGSVWCGSFVSLYCPAWVLAHCDHFCLPGMRLTAQKLMEKQCFLLR